ncbi:MAG TPA: tetratricopeptide repeat protein [Candidatus Acidoferrum sp.]|nr:tetratricopeptide repeat protein [Candidatus Acidoferrum sp.]
MVFFPKIRRAVRTASLLAFLPAIVTAGRALPADPIPSSQQSPSGSLPAADPRVSFEQGQAALRSGDLAAAEAAFRRVLAVDPQSGAAYANLGVIAMRRKEWDHALLLLQKAEQLEPKMTGIRLNIGLANYRRGDYAAAIAPFESVVRDQPDSQQARYLLGLCQEFTEKYEGAVSTLEPLWSQMSGDVTYLYVLDIAAHNAGKSDLDEKALNRLIEIGGQTPEFQLILGKAYLNRDETDKAISELELASGKNPNLPYLHFSLGLAYAKKQDLPRAESEFQKDIAIEPDLPDNYEQLGLLYLKLQKQDAAEHSFRQALHYNPRMPVSLLELGRIYQQQGKNREALSFLNTAEGLAPDNQNIHYIRGQVLLRMGRRKDAEQELAISQKILNSGLNKQRKNFEVAPMPSPELKQQQPQ